MARQQIVATKAIIMLASHMMKIVYFGVPMLLAATSLAFPPLWFFIAVIPLSVAGTVAGTKILHRLSDVGFRSYTKYIVTVIGIVYLWRGANLMGWL